MGKSPTAGCLRIISFGNGKDSNQIKSKRTNTNDHHGGGELQKNASKRRWSFRKKASQHRVLRTTVAHEPLSPTTERDEKELVCDQDKQIRPARTEKCSLSMLMEKTSGNEEATLTLNATQMTITDAVDTTHDMDRNMEISSTIKIQAAIRAYLARRELYRLKGIVKLQAHVRGQLVRKQAARTLRCVQAIIKFQALVRARRVRLSEQGLAIQERLEFIRQQHDSKGNKLGRNVLNVSMNNNNVIEGKLLANGFAHQLLENIPKTDSPHIEYDPDDPNSGWKWLERWMASSPWESGLSVRPKTVAEYQNQSANVQSTEGEVAGKMLNSNLVPVLNESVVEADKQNLSLTNELNSSSLTSDHIPPERNNYSLKVVSKPLVDSIVYQPSKQLNHVSSSGFSNHNAHNEDCNPSLREASRSISDSHLDKQESKSKKCNNLKFDSVPDKLSIQLKNLSDSRLEPVVDWSGVEPHPSEVALRQKPHKAVDTHSDQTKVDGENCLCNSTKALNAMPDSLHNVKNEAENSKSISSKVSHLIMNFEYESSEIKNGSSNLRLDSSLDQPDVDENSNYTLKKSLSATWEFNSKQPKGDSEKSTSGSTEVPSLTLGSVSDDVRMELAHVSNSVIHSVSNQPGNAPDPIFSSSDQHQSQVNAENPKCNMDKLSNSIADYVSDQLEPRAEKLTSSSINMADSVCASDPSKLLSGELHRIQETVPLVQGASEVEPSASSPERQYDSPQQSITSGEEPVLSKPDKNDSENSGTDLKATTRRSSSGSGKVDRSSGDSQGSPSLPSYMAATVSAKAKVRSHNSPKSSPDVQEKISNAKRRNSLPGSHGKQHSVSPRIQRSPSQVQRTTSGNGVISPKGSSEKPKQTEWRR